MISNEEVYQKLTTENQYLDMAMKNPLLQTYGCIDEILVGFAKLNTNTDEVGFTQTAIENGIKNIRSSEISGMLKREEAAQCLFTLQQLRSSIKHFKTENGKTFDGELNVDSRYSTAESLAGKLGFDKGDLKKFCYSQCYQVRGDPILNSFEFVDDARIGAVLQDVRKYNDLLVAVKSAPESEKAEKQKEADNFFGIVSNAILNGIANDVELQKASTQEVVTSIDAIKKHKETGSLVIEKVGKGNEMQERVIDNLCSAVAGHVLTAGQHLDIAQQQEQNNTLGR